VRRSAHKRTEVSAVRGWEPKPLECSSRDGIGERRVGIGPLKGGSRSIGQARKCTGWMPRHEPAKKDVASCEKPRGAASERRSGGIRMGKPGGVKTLSPEREPTQGTETSQYLEEEKSNEIP
jgi:hypothetical protein